MNKIKHLFTLLVMLINVIPSFAQLCDHPDYAPLVALYEATDGDNWTTSWDLSNCDVCSYSGITCNVNGQIEEINLVDNSLNGLIPSEISMLKNLKFLFLSGNSITGSIPKSLGNLTSLEILHLTSNQLSESIPSEIGNLTELVDLRLDFNSFSGTIPSSLGNLKNIINFTLRGNNLTGSIPGSLGNLSIGEFLILDNNNLTGSLPKELGNFGNQREINPNALGGINVANNNLSGCYPIEFKAFCRTDFRLIIDGNEHLSDFSEFCFFENGVCNATEVSCDNLQFVSDSSEIVVSGLSTASKLEIIGKNTNYQTIVICDGACMESQEIIHLSIGDYTIKVNLFDGENYCYREEVITIESSNPIAGTTNCSQLIFTGENGQITLEGLTANYNKVEIIGRNTDWQVITVCDGDCPPTLSIPDLESGEYVVKVNQGGNDPDGHGGSYCYREEQVIVGNNSSDIADCDKLDFSVENGQIIVDGLTASYDKVEIIGRNTGWQVITICDGDCDDTQIIPDLAAGEYSVKVNQGGTDPDGHGGSYCYREEKILLENGSSNRNKELDFMDNLVLYPNPAIDRINIELPNLDIQKGTVKIYNVFEQLISAVSIDQVNQDVLAIDLNGYENGIYVMTIQLNGLPKFSQRFVVEHLK